LRWEKVGTLNLGIDFRSKGSRLSGSFEWYRKRATDLFSTVPIDYTSGLSQVVKNVASIQANGIDIELRSLNTRGAIEWTSDINLSFYKDKVLDYYLENIQGSQFISPIGASLVTPVVGMPVFGMFSYAWAGLDPLTGDPMGYLNKTVSKNYAQITGGGTSFGDLVYHGQMNPKVFGNLGNTIAWKDFALTARVSFKFGHYFRRGALNYSDLFKGRFENSEEFAIRWQKPGDEQFTDVPSLVYPLSSTRALFYSGSEINVGKADHIRINYIALSYDLRKEQWKFLPFESAQVYLNVSNLGIIWRANKWHVDPDVPITNLPRQTQFAMGLRIGL
jgi:hypothetical protein